MAALALSITLVGASAERSVSLDRLGAASRLLEEGKISQARAILLEEFKRDARNPRVVRALAIAEREAGNDEAALDYWQRLCTLTAGEEAGFAWKQRGLTERRLHQDLEALTSLQTAQSLLQDQDPGLSQLVSELAMTVGAPTNPKSGFDPRFPSRVDTQAAQLRLPQPPDPLRHLPRKQP